MKKLTKFIFVTYIHTYRQTYIHTDGGYLIGPSPAGGPKCMKKEALRSLVKIKAKETAFSMLLKDKEKCSKLKSLKYLSLELQPYLSTKSKLTNMLRRVLFRWRCHAINVKQNIGIKDAKCPLCKDAADTQYHLLTCPKLSSPQPWTIESVVNALRQREIIIEEEKKSADCVTK